MIRQCVYMHASVHVYTSHVNTLMSCVLRHVYLHTSDACIHLCICLCVYASKGTFVCTCVHIFMHVCTYICFVHICTYTLCDAYLYICVYICM